MIAHIQDVDLYELPRVNVAEMTESPPVFVLILDPPGMEWLIGLLPPGDQVTKAIIGAKEAARASLWDRVS